LFELADAVLCADGPTLSAGRIEVARLRRALARCRCRERRPAGWCWLPT
jgi:hypothetical protein